MSTPETAPPTEARRVLPAAMLERDRHPFDPPPGLTERRGRGPVTSVDLGNGGRAFLVTAFDEAREVLGDTRFSADRTRHPEITGLAPDQLGDGPDGGPPISVPAVPVEERGDGMFVFMDPPEHTRLRRPLTGWFTVRRMRALEARMREIAADAIEEMRAAGTTADLVPAFALTLPSLVICELLGVDPADRGDFQANTSVALDSTSSDAERARAGGELYAFMARLVAGKRDAPGDDLLSSLAHEADPPLSDAQLVDVALVLLGAGHETTANMLGLGTFALLEHPEALAALRDDPSRADDAVEELLRYLSIIQLGVSRVTTEPVTLGGVDLPAGATVIVATPEVNRDPQRWDRADDLDLSRSRTPHLAFGHGVHQCLGQQLARAEMRVGLTELLTRLPGLRLTVEATEVPLKNEMLIFGVRSLPVAWD